MLLLSLLRPAGAPTTIGDGTSGSVAMTIGLVSMAQLSDPRSQGDDQTTQALTTDATPKPADEPKQAEGAGTSPAEQSGGSSNPDRSKIGPVTVAGGGGGTKDDPWARSSLQAPTDIASSFDLAHRSDAMFWSRVEPCLSRAGVAAVGLTLEITLDGEGNLAASKAVSPTPQGRPVQGIETKVVAAVKACGPYRDILVARALTLKIPSPSSPA